MIVELAWHEAANHEVARLEGEVDGRRLVDAAGDRLEVVDVEGEWPQVAVPPDQVERVVGVVIGSHPPASLDLDHEISGLEVGRHLLGRADVALAVRGVLEQLAVLVAVAPRRLDLRRALQPEHPLRVAIRDEAIGRPDGDHQVVPRAVGDRAEDRLESPAPLVDEEHLVRLAVAVEADHRLRRTDHPERDVAVGE